MSKKNRGKNRNPGSKPGGGAKAQRVGTATLVGFDQHIHALGSIPLVVNRALPLIERGDPAQGSALLQEALVKVELGKACILGNLAFAAMKAGDNESALGYLAVAVDSLEDLGLEENEIFQMLNLAHAQLSGGLGKTADTASGGTPEASTEPVTGADQAATTGPQDGQPEAGK